MTHTLLIHDLDVRYAIKLAEYINNDRGFPFEARFCTEEDMLEDYINKWNVDLLLVEELLYEQASALISKDRIIVLSDSNYSNVDSEFCIFKYQSIEVLIKQILRKVSMMDGIGQLVHRRTRLKLCGVYSPNYSELQTELAIDIGRVLSGRGKTLYISLNGMSDLESMLNIEFDVDLTEIIFEICGLNHVASAVIGSHIYKFEADMNTTSDYPESYTNHTGNGINNLDIMPDAKSYHDMTAVSFDEWREFISKLENETDYEYVVVDITESIANMFGILSCCNKIYTFYSDEKNVMVRNEKYIETLEREGIEGLSSKLNNLDITNLIMGDKKDYFVKLEGLMNEDI